MGEAFVPDWAAPANVKALQTTRNGGVSKMPWASFNLGDHVGDDPAAVAANRRALREALPGEPRWLTQVHGIVAVDADWKPKTGEADAAFARRPGTVCAVMTADCLPVLLCDRRGSVVAAAHAGWRGLLDGVLESVVAAMAAAPGELLAWLGPAIGPRCFEVGTEVRAAFVHGILRPVREHRFHGGQEPDFARVGIKIVVAGKEQEKFACVQMLFRQEYP